MGLLDMLSGDAVMSGTRYFFLDDDDKKTRICHEAGQRMAPAIAGTVKVRDRGKEVHVTGRFGQYPVNVIIWVTFANFRLKVTPLRPLAGAFDTFQLHYDDEAAKRAREKRPRPEWEDEDAESRWYVSPAVYAPRKSRQRYEMLPPELMSSLVAWLESSGKDGPSFRIDGDVADLYLNDSNIVLSKTSAQRLHGLLQLVTAILSAAEARWPPPTDSFSRLVASAERAAFGASPGPPQGPPPIAPSLGPGSPVLVTWGDGNRYPATVLEEAPGQYLCAFPNGQQQWVGAAYVAPA